MINLVLCGGSGTRLWPLSRQAFPKQFVKLFNGRSLFQETVMRNSAFFEKICIVTNSNLDFIAADQISETGCKNEQLFILEPVGRNTAPAIALACFHYNPDEIIFVTPSDHMILNVENYGNCIKEAVKSAEQGNLVTFGINPDYPETGYGYIEVEEKRGEEVILKAAGFKEKPDIKTAENFVKAGNYFWNSGMFLFKAGVFLEELKRYSPLIYEKAEIAYKESKAEKTEIADVIRIYEAQMLDIPADSIDYAVMEKSDSVYVVPASIGWTDMGSFDALKSIVSKDSMGNSIDGNCISIESKNNLCLVNGKKTALIGVEDLTVVDTDDALLISKSGFSQKVKNVVSILNEGSDEDRLLTVFHSKVYRPWGAYTVLLEEPGFKAKKIEVYPDKRLSLQKHKYRSENWVVVEGEALVQVGKSEFIKKPGESVYIGSGEKHRLTNKCDSKLVIIETQTGEYLGEDDIERFEDDFGRAGG